MSSENFFSLNKILDSVKCKTNYCKKPSAEYIRSSFLSADVSLVKKEIINT